VLRFKVMARVKVSVRDSVNQCWVFNKAKTIFAKTVEITVAKTGKIKDTIN